jgi:ribA/ribD-fused uncharacterized protein
MAEAPQRLVIKFYSKNADYYWLSNFSAHSVKLEDKEWPTVEHFFQAKKFASTPYEEEIRKAIGPSAAKAMGSRRRFPLRADWEDIKEHVMKRALHAKFTQHVTLKQVPAQMKEVCCRLNANPPPLLRSLTFL